MVCCLGQATLFSLGWVGLNVGSRWLGMGVRLDFRVCGGFGVFW